jgi:hypothetical protein
MIGDQYVNKKGCSRKHSAIADASTNISCITKENRKTGNDDQNKCKKQLVPIVVARNTNAGFTQNNNHLTYTTVMYKFSNILVKTETGFRIATTSRFIDNILF